MIVIHNLQQPSTLRVNDTKAVTFIIMIILPYQNQKK